MRKRRARRRSQRLGSAATASSERGEPVSGAVPADAEREHLQGTTGDGDAEGKKLHLQGATGDGDAERKNLHLQGTTGDGDTKQEKLHLRGTTGDGDAEQGEKQHLRGTTGDGDAKQEKLHLLQGATGYGDAEGERLHLGGPTGAGELRGTRDAKDEASIGEEKAAGEVRERCKRDGVQENGKGGGVHSDPNQNGGQPQQPGDDQPATHQQTLAFPGVEPQGLAHCFYQSGASGGGSQLLEAILSWTMTDVLNDDLYRDKVPNIPDIYESPAHFCEIQSQFLLEETRALICSSINNGNGKEIQFCQLLSADHWDSCHGYFLDIDLTDMRCQHIATDGDVCLLSLKAPLVSHLGIVVDVGRDLLFQRSFRVLVSDVDTFEPEKIKCVSFLTNIANELEIANILSLRDERDKNAINSLLGLYKMVEKKCSTCVKLPQDNDSLRTELSLNLACLHQDNTQIIWAPPGTLKGSVTAVLEYVNNKILICVPNESSLSDMIIDLKELSISPDFGDVLVLNNMGQQGIKKYEEFFLHHQSQELYCFLSQSKALKLMASLLDLSTYYHIHCAYADSCERCSKPGLLRFSVNSFKEKFDLIWSLLFSCLVYLKNHAAVFSLPEQDSINELMNVLTKFKNLLYDKNQRDDYIGAALGLVPPAAINAILVDSASTIAWSLNEERLSCIKLIESIQKSLQLPVLENRDAIDRFCIKHSRIIVATLDCTWQLHGMDKDSFDILLVHCAGQIREDQLLASFLLPVRHTVLCGDHLHLQPYVQSTMCKEAGYGVSIFERLHQLVSEKNFLKAQHTMHPSISKFPNQFFYKGIVKDGHNVISAKYNEFIPITLPSYGFMDISANYLRQTRKAYVSSAAIILLVQKFCEGIAIPSTKVNIAVICLSKDDSNTVRDMLRFKKEIHERIYLEVKSIDNLQEESFDIIILSLLIDNKAELERVKKNNLNVALTSARHCLWMVGEQNVVSDTGGIWRSLIYDAKARLCIEKVDINKLTDITKQLEMNGKGHCPDSNSRHANKIIQMPGQEFTWAERPYMTKMILATVRDQRGQPDTCSFQSASGAVESLLKHQNAGLVPPQEFNWTFVLDDWKNEYETVAPKRFLLEDKADRGEKRIQTSLGLFKNNGVKASNESGTKFQRFKIKDYGEMDIKNTKDVTSHLNKGGIMVGSFQISRNYFSLSPRDVYVYDPDKVIKHDKSGLTASHVTMVIGIGHRLTPAKRFSRHMVIQNSEGKLFGINGIGRIGKKTLKKLYWIEVEDVKPPSQRPASA